MALGERGKSIVGIIALLLSIVAILGAAFVFLVVYDNGRLLEKVPFVGEKLARFSTDDQSAEPGNGDDQLEAVFDEIRSKFESAKGYFNEKQDSIQIKAKLNEAKELLVRYKQTAKVKYSEQTKVLTEKINDVLKSLKDKSKETAKKLDGLVKYVDIFDKDKKDKDQSKDESKKESKEEESDKDESEDEDSEEDQDED